MKTIASAWTLRASHHPYGPGQRPRRASHRPAPAARLTVPLASVPPVAVALAVIFTGRDAR